MAVLVFEGEKWCHLDSNLRMRYICYGIAIREITKSLETRSLNPIHQASSARNQFKVQQSTIDNTFGRYR